MGIRPTRRKLLGAGAATLAAAALAVGIAGPANAATYTSGNIGFGTSDLKATPNAPATGFATPGTAGVLSFNDSDGSAQTVWGLDPGLSSKYVISLPQGLEFASTACAGYPKNYPFGATTATCSLSADKRTLTETSTLSVSNGFAGIQPFDVASRYKHSLPIVSTGPITGNVVVSYTPFQGMTTLTPTATLLQADIPWAGQVGPTGPVGGLNVTGPDGTGQYTLNGTGDAGATVTITDAKGATWTTTVQSDGTWIKTLPTTVQPPLTITQTVNGTVSAPVTYNTAPLPIMNPGIALGALALAGAAIGGTVLVRRRRVATATASA